MPRAKKVVKKIEETSQVEPMKVFEKPYSRLVIFAFLVVAFLALLGWKNKGWFVVAMVNGRPVTRLELEGRLVGMYGQTTLDDLVNERILKDAAAAKGIKVTSDQIDTKIEDLKKQLPVGTTIEQALASQNRTISDLRHQVEIRLMIEKLVADQVTISDADIANFVSTNKAMLTATEEGKIKDQAREILLQQKTSEAFSKYFSDLKSKSPVTKYL